MTDCNPVDVGATQSMSKSDENASHVRSSPLSAEVRKDIHPKGEICSVDVEICTVCSILFYLVFEILVSGPIENGYNFSMHAWKNHGIRKLMKTWKKSLDFNMKWLFWCQTSISFLLTSLALLT